MDSQGFGTPRPKVIWIHRVSATRVPKSQEIIWNGFFQNSSSFPKRVWTCLGFFWARQGPGMGPKCGPGGQLSNAGVSSESGQWRPDWWQKHVLKKTQEPTIVGANYTSLGVPRQLAVRAQGCSGSQNFGTPGTL